MPLLQPRSPALASGLDVDSLEQFWNEQVFGKPSIFARLVYLSQLWDPGAGRYFEATLEGALDPEGMNHVIRTTHELTFSRWLAFTLEQQKADVEIYLQGTGAILTVRLRPESYSSLIPESALPHERQLFLFDMAVVVELIQARTRRSASAIPRLVPVRA